MCLYAVSPTISAQAKGRDAGPYISASDFNRREGLKLNVPGRGVFSIVGIEPDRRDDKECKIDSASLIELILESDFRAPQTEYAAAKKAIKMKGEKQGDEIICSGSGDGCTVMVTVWDPDDPVLPN